MLITGATGLLGHWLMRMAPEGTEIVALTHRRNIQGISQVQADLRDRNAAMAAVQRIDPSVIIHAAYAHDREAIVNATEHVVEAACHIGADVVYISTDAVFSGDGIGRDEGSVPDPVWDYGRWKSEAERAARELSATTAIVRLPLLVSFEPDDHVVREIRLSATQGNKTQWFVGETRQPALAHEVAMAVWKIVSLTTDERAGTWHLPGPERLTRYEIALRVVDHLGLSRDLVEEIVAPEEVVRPCDTFFTDQRARAKIDWHPSPILR